MAELRSTGVDVDGLLMILGQHLYSTPLVAIRELVQNAHDSVVRRRMTDPSFSGGAIRIISNPAAGTITVEDNGAGMTATEIGLYLATIGSGATREARSESGSTELIGYFGIGFLASFEVASLVSVHTTSWTESTVGSLYRSRGGRRYTLDSVEPHPVGTAVTLELKDRYKSIADRKRLRDTLTSYCALLPVPVTIDGDDEPINVEPPPWRAEPGATAEHPAQVKRREAAFAARFQGGAEPLCTIRLRPRGGSDAAGLIWIQAGATYGTSDNRNVSVFVRGMLLSTDARELLPDWAGFVGMVIESDNLVPTASRESLQKDEHWKATASSVLDQLLAGLKMAATDDPHGWSRVLRRHNEALMGAALCDSSLFLLMADSLPVPTSEGDMTVREIVRAGSGQAHVSVEERDGLDEVVFRALQVPVARGERYAVLPFLRRYCTERAVPLVELGTSGGDRRVFAPAQVSRSDREWLAKNLGGPREEVIPSRFGPTAIPLVVVVNRDVQLKRRIEADETDRRIASAALRLARAHTAAIDATVASRVYVNLDNQAIKALLSSSERDAHRNAIALLVSLKGILSGSRSNSGGPGTSLQEALDQYSTAIASMIGDA